MNPSYNLLYCKTCYGSNFAFFSVLDLVNFVPIDFAQQCIIMHVTAVRGARGNEYPTHHASTATYNARTAVYMSTLDLENQVFCR